jgi:HlyD family secretion protein
MRMVKIRRRILIVILPVIIAVGVGVWLWQLHKNKKSGTELVLYGNVDIRQVQLAFNGNERIATILVKEGDKVKRGRLLATLETQRLEAVVRSKEAQVAMQQQVVDRLVAGSRPEEIRKDQADVEAAAAEAHVAELNEQRIRNLLQKDEVSQQQADDAKASLNAAQARLKSAKEVLKLAIAGPRKEDIAAAKATLNAYKADLTLALRELADANLYAPADGIIENRLLEPGDMASPQQPVLTLALTEPLWVRAYISETDLGKIRLGMTAEVRTDSYPGKRYQAWVGFISPTAEFTPKSVETAEVRTKLVYQVRVFVQTPHEELRLGMPAVVTIPLNQSHSTDAEAETKTNEGS